MVPFNYKTRIGPRRHSKFGEGAKCKFSKFKGGVGVGGDITWHPRATPTTARALLRLARQCKLYNLG
jgi:hypothetical protein